MRRREDGDVVILGTCKGDSCHHSRPALFCQKTLHTAHPALEKSQQQEEGATDGAKCCWGRDCIAN